MDKDKTIDQRPPKPPDPNGEPVPFRHDGLGCSASALVATGVAVVLGTPVLLGMLTPCVGATRSARLLRAGRESELAEELSQFEQQANATTDSLMTPPAEQP
jgi:hypothetical protein